MPSLSTQRPWRTGPFVLTFLALSGCGSTVSLDTPPASAPTRPPMAAATSSAIASDVAPLANAAAATPTEAPQVRPMAAPSIEAQPLSRPDTPNGYAARADAEALATELAERHGLDRAWVWSVLSQARFQDSVPRLMMPPPTPTAKNWAAYRSRFIEPRRIQAGAQFWREHRDDLTRAETTYGVPTHIIVGVIGVETFYGRHMGRYRVLDALTTLTLDFPKGRSDRSAFFKAELGAFLLMCKEQGLSPTEVTGSFAGAMGWPQFMPSSARNLAIDFDGDRRVDLIGSPTDAIGSVARYLAHHGWQSGQATYFRVTPPSDTTSLEKLLAPDILPSFTAEEMQARGASLSTSGQAHTGPLALVQLHNAGNAPTYVAGTANFYAITRYNQSSYYALAVAQLGEAISQEVRRQNGATSSAR